MTKNYIILFPDGTSISLRLIVGLHDEPMDLIDE